jgi:regulator of replication initiation timing
LRRCGGAPDAVKEEKMIRGENLGDLQQELEDLRAENLTLIEENMSLVRMVEYWRGRRNEE